MEGEERGFCCYLLFIVLLNGAGQEYTREIEAYSEQKKLKVDMSDIDVLNKSVKKLCSYWNDVARGMVINENGQMDIRKWLRTYSIEEIKHGMDIVAEQYLEYKEDGTVTKKSWEEAFSKIPAICRVECVSKDDPELRDLYLIRGILRRNIRYYYDDAKALEFLKDARNYRVSLTALRKIAHEVTSWTKLKNALHSAIDSIK